MTREEAGIYYSRVRVPGTVALDATGQKLKYSYPAEGAHWCKPTDRTLQTFSRLGNAAPEEIRDFARRNGVLQAVRIKPQYRNQGDLLMRDRTVWRFGYEALLESSEPLELWRTLAEQLRAILKINAALKGRSKNPSPSLSPNEWGNLDPGGDPLDDVRDEQFFLQIVVNRWLSMGKVRMKLETAGYSREETKWDLEVAYDGLVGALAYRLLLTVVGEDRLYVCSGCGEPYVRDSRAPRPGQDNFCGDCGEIAGRRAVERYRQKRKNRREK